MTFIDFYGNELARLPDGVFDELSELRSLTLGGNKLTDLPAGTFKNNANLEYMWAEENSLRRLRKETFAHLSEMKEMRFGINKITELPVGFFDNMPELTTIDLSGNSIESLPPGIFSSNTKLCTISLTRNKFSSLPDDVFNDLPELWGLYLGDNELTHLPAGLVASPNPKLQDLFIGWNEISSLPPGLLERLDANVIRKLGLDGIQLNESDIETLATSRLLIVLYVANTGIGDGLLQKYLQIAEKPELLLVLGMSFNDLGTWFDNANQEDIDAFLSNLGKLTAIFHFYIGDPTLGVQDLKTILEHLPSEKLSEIDLSGGDLVGFNWSTLNRFPRLNALYANDAGLTELTPRLFAEGPELSVIRMSGNRFTDIDEFWFAGLDSLYALYLDRNPQEEELFEDDFFSILPSFEILVLPAVEPKVVSQLIYPVRPIILRIEPQIRNVGILVGNSAWLSFDAYGRQNILDNDLVDQIDSVVWSVDEDGGELSRQSSNSVFYTAPEEPVKHVVTVNIPHSSGCLWRQDGEEEADALARCTAEFDIVVFTPSMLSVDQPELMNPPGVIPAILTDGLQNQYEVVTPEEGGAFMGDGFSFSAPPGAVHNGEILGISMSEDGVAPNLHMAHHRYIFGGNWYHLGVVDNTGSPISSYSLNASSEVCIPLPDAFRGNIRDVAVMATKHEELSVRSASIRLRPDGEIQIRRGLSELPARIAAVRLGAPSELIEPMPETETLPPDTGGVVPTGFALFLILIIGTFAVLFGSYVALKKWCSPSSTGARNAN